MEAVAATGLNFTPFDNDQISKLSPILWPVNTYEASFMSDNLLMSVLSPSSVVFDSNSPYSGAGRAIFTILLPSSQILVVNSAACQLINYNSDELCSMKLEELIHESHKHKLTILFEDFYSESDDIPGNSGQLLEFLRKDGESIPVSLYLKKIDNPQKCLAIVEPVDQRIGLISIEQNGRIISHDEEIALIFQYDPSELVGYYIYNLLPAINLSPTNEQQWNETSMQQITGRTKSGESFPVSLSITGANPNSKILNIKIWVYGNLSGLILLNKRLLITNFNHYFMKLLFGFSKKEIINEPIEKLIPTFCRNIEQSKNQSVISNETKESSKSEAFEWSVYRGNSTTQDSLDNFNSSSASNNFNNCTQSPKQLQRSNAQLNNESENDFNLESLSSDIDSSEKKEGGKEFEHSSLEWPNESNGEGKMSLIKKIVKLPKGDAKQQEKIFHPKGEDFLVQEGKFLGLARHSDGSYIDVKYQIKNTAVSEDNFYCIGLSLDLQKFTDVSRGGLSAGVTSSFNTTSFDISLPKDSNCSEQYTRPSTASIISQCDENLTAGDYSQYYTNIKQIGKGAFGYVKMAFRNSDGLLVVTKFIKKQKINIRSWVFHSNLNIKIPLEISLLISLQHPNIVKVLDVFHNDSFVQLVMEKHGAGFDLFEFINRGPKCDEKLKSYIFRQIISAVHYLDSLGILHRDIKDENVIINEKFEVKLIDFGSATFMPPDETFSKFYGTVEYCSPEVLQGNNYKGPELEIWALGVTLYVLTFGENPFSDIEETIKGQFSIPSPISKQLDDLLHKMLDKNVETRITINEVAENPWINQPVCIDSYRFDEVVRCYDDEAYPPKYVYEIHSDDIYSRRDSGGDSDQLAETNNSNSSLQNTTADELGDLDDNFQDSNKVTIPDTVGNKGNISPVFFSTPVQRRNDRLCKSAMGLPKGLEDSLQLNDGSRECRVAPELNLHSSPCLNESGDLKEELNLAVFNNSDEIELEIRFKNCVFLEEENVKRKDSQLKGDSHNLSQEIYELSNENGCQEYSIAEDEGVKNE